MLSMTLATMLFMPSKARFLPLPWSVTALPFLTGSDADALLMRFMTSISALFSTGSTQSACSVNFDSARTLHLVRYQYAIVPVVGRGDDIVVGAWKDDGAEPVDVRIVIGQQGQQKRAHARSRPSAHRVTQKKGLEGVALFRLSPNQLQQILRVPALTIMIMSDGPDVIIAA